PEFPELAQQLVFMGGSLNPATDDPEFANNPRHEFNFWFDPEAAEIVLRAGWKKITCTPADISIQTRLSPAMVQEIKASGTPLAQYLARYFQPGPGSDYMWDELAAAAWIDPTLITKWETRYMGVDIDHGAGYGNTLTWTEDDKSKFKRVPVDVQTSLDADRFYRMFVDLMRAAPLPAH
ncbi:MAG: nucleoside hydrolase, partial [Candidatus Acidiferrales bacterium]